MTDPSVALIAEQFSHAIDLLKAENKLLTHRVTELEKHDTDHETRIRVVNDSINTFKSLPGVASGVATLLAIISLVKAFFIQ